MSSKKDLIDIGSGSFGINTKKRELKKMKGGIAGGIVGVLLAFAIGQNPIFFGVGGLIVGRMLMN